MGEPIHPSKQVRKILRILPKSWEFKADAINEAKDLKVLTMDALIGNLQTHEMNRNQETSKKEVKRDKSLALKVTSSEVFEEDEDVAYLTRRFWKIVRKMQVSGRQETLAGLRMQMICATSVKNQGLLSEIALCTTSNIKTMSRLEETKTKEWT